MTAIDAGIVVALALGALNVLALWRHEGRDERRATAREERERARHENLIREVHDLRRVALGAIQQRVDLAAQVEDHEQRLTRLEGGR